MIYFCITRKHSYTLAWFLSDWASAKFKKHVQVIPYDMLPQLKNITPAAVIFADIERLNSFQLKIAEDFCDQLVSHDKNIPIFNNPRFVLSRYSLLRKLHDSGLNRFNVYQASDKNCEPSYPVFLRMDNDHEGPLSKLLDNRQQIDQIVLRKGMQGLDIKHMMLTEYCETKDNAGYYRKYSAFRIGEQIIPSHPNFNNAWMVKGGKPLFEKSHELEREKYIKENPHKEKIHEIFEIAGVTYGRIDYSMLEGSIQTWEINTNPVFNKLRQEYKTEEMVLIKERLTKWLEEGLMLHNHGGDITEVRKKNQRIPLSWDFQKYV